MHRACLAGIALAGALWAAEFWDKKPYTNWTEQEVAHILIDSPWAKEVIIRVESNQPVGVAPPPLPPPPASIAGMNTPNPNLGGGPLGPSVGRKVQTLPPGATVRVRWESAEPLRQAIARTLFNYKAAEELAKSKPETYRLAIDNIPPYLESARFGSLLQDLKSYTLLRVGKRMVLRPSEVTISANRGGLIVRLDFPRDNPILEKDGQVTLETEAGVSGIDCRFSLRDMLFGGRLAL